MAESRSRRFAAQAIARGKGERCQSGAVAVAWRRRASTGALRASLFSLVVTVGISLLGLFCGGMVESFAQKHAARGASGGGDGIAIGELVTKVRAVGSERGIADGVPAQFANRPTMKAASNLSDTEEVVFIHISWIFIVYCRTIRLHNL